MGDAGNDPTGLRRTRQALGGQTTSTAEMPGLILVAVTVAAFVTGLAGFALHQVGVGVSAAIVMLLAAGAALSWLTTEARRVREVERGSRREHARVRR